MMQPLIRKESHAMLKTPTDASRSRLPDSSFFARLFDELPFKLMRWSGLCYLLRKALWRNRDAILLYHDPDPEALDAHLTYLKRTCRVVSLREALSAPGNGPRAVISIDDGHIGNLRLGEVFRKHNVRPMIYICTGIASLGAGFWWQSAQRKGSDLQALKALSNSERKAQLGLMGFEQTAPVLPREVVSLDELRAMESWADLGAHTRFHPILTRCDDEESREEIEGSKTELLPLIGLEFQDFAYPNGDYTDREACYVKNAGFVSARTCDPGWNDAETDRYRLKSVYIDDSGSVDKFAVQLTVAPALVRAQAQKTKRALANLSHVFRPRAR
jgi:peptidoglycan/xylan/chitin deacetylase (PgdA/CDA1 family)